jgi:acyl-coenzyme A synthetase/AMP-(fatty) acid ligase/thioesterase domain-containing protein/acyl carrier protein
MQIQANVNAKCSTGSETLLSRLEKQLGLHAERRALKQGSRMWSYEELDAISARCAVGLQDRYENPIAPVALLMEHDLPLIATIVGVLRSGGFYVSLNPTYPLLCLRQIVEELRPCALIADEAHLPIAGGLGLSGSDILPFENISTSSCSFSAKAISPDDRIAVFYTGGSTGAPKPIFYTHGSALNEANNYARSLRISAHDRVTLLSACSAAASVSSLFGALLNGACVFPFNPARQGLKELQGLIETEGITLYHSIPSLFRRFTQNLPAKYVIPSIRAIKLGGEPVFAADLELFHEHFRADAFLVNGLGISEANGNVTHFVVSHGTRVSTPTVPVGRPLPGFEIKVLDQNGREVDATEIGEITVRRQHMSFDVPVNDSFGGAPSTKNGWLRTGDLARWDEEGNLIHLGRKDDRLKLRGLWLSPAEIESVLVRIPGVGEAAVVVTDRGEVTTSLTAFLSWKGDPWPEGSLRLEVQKQLPPHSVPNRFFTLKELPLLPSGKIDRVTLGRRATELMRSGSSEADPDDMLELQLVRIWEKVLAVEAVSTTDDFFALGGDSLAAATMLAAVEKFCRVDLPTASLLEARTIKKLADLIRRGGLSQTDLRLVALRLAGSRPPLYYVPGAGGDALEARMLARYLTNEQPVLAFQPRHFNGRSPYPRSVEEMAKSYIETMRVNQPRGPYYLCGHSSGGVVAFEMARQLDADREEVAFLGLIDSYGGAYPKQRRRLTPRKRLKQALLRFLPRGQYTASLGLLKHGLKEQMNRWLVRRIIMLDGYLPFRALRCPSKLRNFYSQEICFAARRCYKLLPFSGKIDLFRAEHQPPSDLFEEDPLLGWGGMAAGRIEVHEIPGNHDAYWQEPMTTAVVAERIEACLEKSRQEITA